MRAYVKAVVSEAIIVWFWHKRQQSEKGRGRRKKRHPYRRKDSSLRTLDCVNNCHSLESELRLKSQRKTD